MIDIIIIILSGIFATAVMCGFLEVVARSKLANADMVRAVGSLFTASYENALKPGLIIQFGFGIVFSFIYFGVLSFFWSTGPAVIGIIGGVVMGFFHGMVVGLSLVIVVAEHHPLEIFRKAGLTVAGTHLFGHMIYGLVIGIIFAASGIRILVTSVG